MFPEACGPSEGSLKREEEEEPEEEVEAVDRGQWEKETACSSKEQKTKIGGMRCYQE